MGEIPAFVNSNLSFSRIGEGLDTIAYRSPGKTVLKVYKRSLAIQDRTGIFDKLVNDYKLLKSYFGDYVCDTEFVLGEGRKANTEDIIGIQSYVEGVNFYEGMELIDNGVKTPERMIDFLQRVVKFCRETGKLPNICPDLNRGLGLLCDWFYPLSYNNIIVQTNGKSVIPVMVDIGFSRISSSDLLIGNIYQVLTVNAARLALTKLGVNEG